MKKILFIIILLLSTTIVAAQEAGTTPDNIFYGLDRAMESLRLAVTLNSGKKAELYLKYAEERLAELEEMVEKGKTKHVEKLIKARDKLLNKTMKRIEKLEEKGKDVSELVAKVEEMHAKHITVLQGLLEKVPEQAREHIQHAIEMSSRSKAVEAITKEKQETKAEGMEVEEKKPGEKPEVPGKEEAEKPETPKKPGETEDVPKEEPGKKGKLVMQITDEKSTLDITSLEVTISDIKVHAAGAGGTTQDVCSYEDLTVEVCTNEAVSDIVTNCTDVTTEEEVCVNVTINDIIELNCTNQTVTEEVCTNETVDIVQEVCENVTEQVLTCSSETESGEGWFTVVDEAKTFDLIEIEDVKEFLGDKDLTVGKYTQVRLSVDSVKLMISGEVKSLKIPSGRIKIISNFNIKEGETTTITLDFDAQKSVHQAGDRYIMKPTIKVIMES